MAGKLNAVLAEAGKTGSEGFAKIAAGAEVATAGIEQATAATAALTAEETKAATAAARLASAQASAQAAQSRAATAALRAAREQAKQVAEAQRATGRPTGVGSPLSSVDIGPLDKAQAAASVAAEKIAKDFRDSAAKVAAAEQKAFNDTGRAAEAAGARAAAAAQKAAAAQIAAVREVQAATERAAATKAVSIGTGINNATAAQLDRDLAAQKAAAKAKTAFEREFQDVVRQSGTVLRDSAQVSIKASESVSAAWRETSRTLIAAARAAEAEQIAAAKAAERANLAAASASRKAAANSFTGKSVGSITDSIKGVPSDVFGAITTSAKFATIGVIGLGVALAGIGLINAAKQQAAVVGFTALAAQISATTDATTGLTVATQGLSQAQSKAIGQDFENSLINLSNNSALSQAALQDTSQALLALGFNGNQAIGIIRDIGNALAASGKTGGQLNEDLKGIVVAFSQIKGSGRLLAQDLNQITTRIPSVSRVQVYLELAKALKLAGANAKEGTPQFNALLTQVQKLAKEGKISSDVAIPAIVKALKEVPGAAADAATGLDALGRQNLTLTGRFEALKDNVRSALAKAFLLPGEAGAPGGGQSLSDRLADEIGAAIPAITSAIKRAGPALSNFVTNLGQALFKIIPPLVALISKLFTALGNAVAKIDLTGIINGLNQLGTKGTDAHQALSDLGTVLRDIYSIAVNLEPVVVGIAKGFALATNALKPFLDIAKAITGVFGSIAGTGFGQSIIALGTVIAAARIGIALLTKALLAAAGAAYKAALTVKEFGTASSLAGNQAALAAGKIEAGAAAGTLAATGFGASLKSLGNKALVIGPLLIAAGEAGHALGEKLTEGSRKAAQALQAAQDNATKLEPAYITLSQHVGDLGVSLDFLSQNLDAVGIQTLADSFTTGQFTDTVSGLINALESSGNTAAQVVAKLESMGISAQDAQDAVKGLGTGIAAANADLAGLSTAAARAQLNALEVQALRTAGAIRGVGAGENPFTAATDDILGFGAASPLNQGAIDANAAATAAADAKAADAIAGGVSGAADTVGSAAKAAADKLKTARDKLSKALSSFGKDIAGASVGDVRKALSELKADVKDVASGSIEKNLVTAISKARGQLVGLAKDLATVQDRLKAAQGRFDEVQQSIKDFASVSSIDLASIGLAAKDATTKLADLSKLRIIRPGQDALNVITGGTAADLKAGAQKFADALQARLDQITAFQANVNKLIKSGLNKTTIDQIISAGPENGGVLAQSLAGASKQTIDAINATQAGIDKAATQLGNTAADSLFRAGKNVVAGLIQGLKDQDKAIVAAMTHIADVLVAEIKARLKLKSPSRVMHAIGQHIGAGLHLGMASKVDAIAGTARTLAAAAVPKMPALTLPAVDASSLRDITAPAINLTAPALGPVTQRVVAKLDSSAIRFDPVTVKVLAEMADVEARASLTPVDVTPQRTQVEQVMSLARPEGAWTRADITRLHRGLENVPGAQTTYNTPITVKAPPGQTDPHATAKVLARAIRSIR